MKNLTKFFDPLTRSEILTLRPGLYADHELLDVAEHFRKNKDRDREMAIFELILRSPEVTETVSYQHLYFETFEYYRWHKDYLTALQWVYAAVAFAEQHAEGLNRANLRRDLADIYLRVGNFNVGLTLYTQLIIGDPGDIWLYNGLGMELPDVGLHSLAIESLDKGLELVSQKDPHQLKKQLLQLRAADTHENQDIRVSAVTALQEQTQHLPTLRASTVSFFRTLLTRPETYEASEEYFMAPLISEIVDLEARELYPEVRRVYDEDRLEPGFLDLDFIHEKWGLPRILPPPRPRVSFCAQPVIRSAPRLK